MTRKLSLVTVAVAAALAAAPSALGQSVPFDRELNRSSLTASAPDAFERAVLAGQLELVTSLDARERSFAAGREGTPISIAAPDAFTRAVASRTAQAPVGGSDAFTRALETRATPGSTPFVDDRFHIAATGTAAPVAVSGSRSEWPYVGLGVAAGMALMLALGLGLRLVRPRRALAH